MYNLGKLKRNVDSVILLIVGIASVVIGVLNFNKLEGFILFTIGLICDSIAIERFFKFENIEKGLNELKKMTQTMIPAVPLEGTDEIYRNAIEIIKDAESVIRATSFGKEERAPDYYFEAVAEKLKKSQEEGRPIEYRVVISSGKKNRRSKIFDKFGVEKWFKRCYVETKWGLDVLIIDNKHLIIAFPEITADESLRKGILFKNKPELVNSIREWYDNYLWKYARECEG